MKTWHLLCPWYEYPQILNVHKSAKIKTEQGINNITSSINKKSNL